MARITVMVQDDMGGIEARDVVDIDFERYYALRLELDGWDPANFMAWALEKLVQHGVNGFNADELRKMLAESKAEIHGKEN